MTKLVRNRSKAKATLADLHDFPDYGIHAHVFDLALFLKNWKGEEVSKTDAIHLIYRKYEERPRRRRLQLNEVENAVGNAYGSSVRKDKGCRYVYNQREVRTSPQSHWNVTLPGLAVTEPCELSVKAALLEYPWSMEAIWEESPLRVDECSSQEVLSHLFDEDELICSGTFFESRTLPLSQWLQHGFSGDLFCPNPMRCRLGTNLQGKASERCRDNVGKRRFLVYESDDESLGFDEKASLIRCLREKTEATLRMVVHSGGKSLHAFFDACEKEEDNWRFMSVAVKYGGDPDMYRPEQQSRLPNAIRLSKGSGRHLLDDHGTPIRQKCLYLNPR